MQNKLTPSKAIKAKCRDCQPERSIRSSDFCEECALEGIRGSKLKAIRKYCLWCMNKSSPEVELCPSKECLFFEYRKGHNPKRAGLGNKNMLSGLKNSAVSRASGASESK
jgi:hypothetical protein